VYGADLDRKSGPRTTEPGCTGGPCSSRLRSAKAPQSAAEPELSVEMETFDGIVTLRRGRSSTRNIRVDARYVAQ
jgi:hypothetical protein